MYLNVVMSFEVEQLLLCDDVLITKKYSINILYCTLNLLSLYVHVNYAHWVAKSVLNLLV